MTATSQLSPVLVERRFEDVDEAGGYTYRGLRLSMSLDGRWASACFYDDEPGVAHITLEPPAGWRAWVLRLRGDLRWTGADGVLGAGAAWQVVPWNDPLLGRMLAALAVRDGVRRINFFAGNEQTLLARPTVGKTTRSETVDRE